MTQLITPVFSVTWSFRNHYNMLICCSRNIYYVLFSVENTNSDIFSGFFDEQKVQKKSIYLK